MYNITIIDIILDCFQFYKQSGQIIRDSIIKKNYGENINNIDIMIKLNTNCFFINCKNEFPNINVISNFNNECELIIKKLNNKYLKFHKIIFSKNTLNIVNFNITNIYLNPFVNISSLEYLILKLYNYISETTNLNPGLKYYQSNDIFMTYDPK